MNKIFYSIVCLSFLSLTAKGQRESSSIQQVEKDLNAYFSSYTSGNAVFLRQPRLEKLTINDKAKTVIVTTSSNFAQQQFDDKLVGKIYKHIRKTLPKPIRSYDLRILTNGMALENYVPGHRLDADDGHALWGRIDYKGKPWVLNQSSPADITHGLNDRHIVIWASHGRYFNNDKSRWEWQRPFLFSTTEDLYTQTIVVPFLMPMLENAGAVVYSPRERDWQTMEYIIDPDGGLQSQPTNYQEYAERYPWVSTTKPGFAAHPGTYSDNENPFTAGHARQILTTKKAAQAYAKWQPYFVKSGRYAVYVSYQTVEGSVDDALYTVFHQGIATEFRVNQRMGGGTWVYLGTFDFDEGSSLENCVMLTNQSKRKGIVTADAVRFGGGMGNIERGGTVSGYPRALEGARYSVQWAGAPYRIYGGRGGLDDYSDDINARSLMENWLSGGSIYNPVEDGENVPFELSLAVHSDAGYAHDGKSLWGSLAICTTDFNGGQLSTGITRQSSKLFASELLDGTVRDLSFKYGSWPVRYLWDKNYSETRLPAVPSAIMETLSHQSFPDMMLGQDPNFRFDLARSMYKTIVRYVNGMHGNPTIIEPLQPLNIAVGLRGNKAIISWTPQDDPQEPTANPTYYILYTAIGNGGFDNGLRVYDTSATINIEPGVPYHFKVAAGNRGGISFPTEVVSAVYEPTATKTILVVNGFHRLSSPAVINDGSRQGFDLDTDIGVSYGLTAGWSGRQQDFSVSRMGIEGPGGLGYSGNELAGHFIAGNDFNYIPVHAEAIASAHKYNVESCSSKAVEIGKVSLRHYDAVDLILGLEKFATTQLKYYKTFPVSMRQKLSAYASQGGRILASGAYVGSDMQDGEEKQFMSKIFKAMSGGQLRTDTISGVRGMGIDRFDFCRALNADHYAVQHADKLLPYADGSFCTMQYTDGSSAAVGYDGPDTKSFIMGFPFESITDRTMRGNIMRGILAFLLKGNQTNQTNY